MRSHLKVFFDFEERTEMLTEAERGRLLLAMLHYAKTGEETELRGNERYLWPVFKADIDRDVRAYEAHVQAGKQGGRPGNQGEGETKQNQTKRNQTKPNRTKKRKTEERRTRTGRGDRGFTHGESTATGDGRARARGRIHRPGRDQAAMPV